MAKQFRLPKGKKIMVYPVIHEGSWLPKGHSGTWQYSGTTFSLTAPIDVHTGRIKDVLTPEEREFFEDPSFYYEHGFNFQPGDLSPLKEDNNFWVTFEYTIRKPVDVVDEDTLLDTLDLSKGLDYLKYALCRSFSNRFGPVAMSYENRYDSPLKKIYLTEDVEKFSKLSKAAIVKTECYTKLKEMSNSKDKLYEFLMIAWLEGINGAKPSFDDPTEFLITKVEELINKDPFEFMEIINNNYEDKALIYKGIKYGILDFNRSGIFTKEGQYLGGSVKEAIAYLNDIKNKDLLIRITAEIDNLNSIKVRK
ncbi:MAG: hypothetical protein HPY57_12920 [Ignavibacteria bacterium]|nr:hypothetical protein [Ignavibacteria bacterium]